jgi:hypothetical protein
MCLGAIHTRRADLQAGRRSSGRGLKQPWVWATFGAEDERSAFTGVPLNQRFRHPEPTAESRPGVQPLGSLFTGPLDG